MTVVGAFLAPAFVSGLAAQDTTHVGPRRTHVVRTGETLWDLAREYLNDPWQWRELFRLNSGTVRDPHWIYPGQTIQLPWATPVDARRSPSDTVRDVARDATRGRDVARDSMRDSASGLTRPTPTIFAAPDKPASGATRVTVGEMSPSARLAAARAGEFVAAPWVVNGIPASRGRIVRSGDVPGIPLTESLRTLQMRERIFVTPPAGSAAAVGDRYVIVRADEEIEHAGSVLVPTGVVRVDRIGERGEAEAHIAAAYGELSIGQWLLPLASPSIDASAVPVIATGGAEGRIVWISGGRSELPTLLSYVIVRGAANTFREGDQLTLLRERGRDASGNATRDEVAVARVVRVSGSTATAIVLRQSDPAIRIGTIARVTARLP